MLDSTQFGLHAIGRKELAEEEAPEELAALHLQGLAEFKAMISRKGPEWCSLSEYEDPQAFWTACEISGGVRVRIVAATAEINAMSPEAQRAAWYEINAWFISRAPVQRRRNA